MNRITESKNTGYNAGSSLRLLSNNRRMQESCVTSVVTNNATQPLDIEHFSRRGLGFVCSTNITRQSIRNKQHTSNAMYNDDDENHDDEKFFQKLKTKIDRDLATHSKNVYRPNSLNPSASSLRKKRCVFNEETENLMKHFKKCVERTDSSQLADITAKQPHNIVDNKTKEAHVASKSVSDRRFNKYAKNKDSQKFFDRTRNPTNNFINNERKRIHAASKIENVTPGSLQDKIVFTPNVLNINCRALPSKFLFENTSPIKENKHYGTITSTANETRIFETRIIEQKIQEIHYCEYGAFTPPCNNATKYYQNSVDRITMYIDK